MIAKIRRVRSIILTLAPLIGLLMAGGASVNWR